MKQTNIKISLVITTYNSAKTLDLTLLSVSRQVEMPYEVIIGDDGSTEDTRELINKWRKQISVPIKHIWQDDKGFRASRIRNLSFAIAQGNYIICIDGDIILNKYFIRDHRRMAVPHYVACGSRVVLSSDQTVYMQKNRLTDLPIHRMPLSHFMNAIRCPWLSYLFGMFYGKNNLLKGRSCNMAFWKEDMMAINGFDETFVGWGLEDTDYLLRILQSGTKKRFIKFGAIQYHQYHKERPFTRVEERKKLIEDVQSGVRPNYCQNGLSQDLPAVEVALKQSSRTEDIIRVLA